MADPASKSMLQYVASSHLRSEFAASMSQMYKMEVPLYADLIEIVQTINADLLASQSLTTLQRLSAERHGAIRLGTPQELYTVGRIFKILDMHAVGYYDLSVAGLPMHATAFRPTSESGLEENSFRVFTTLVRPELLAPKARELSQALLERRQIFSAALMDILNIANSQSDRLTKVQAAIFIREALHTFSWQPMASSTLKEYEILREEHPILADIACFKTAHINHLTPRTLDISLAQEAMVRRGMQAKDRIEGPPPRSCPILLRQTSFMALREPIGFLADSHNSSSSMVVPSIVPSTHTARFGEIEQRGAALTQAGRNLYDALLSKSVELSNGLGPHEADICTAQVFTAFPDTWESLRAQNLIFCRYKLLKKPPQRPVFAETYKDFLSQLIAEGYVEASPITYEDFLPFSAAGIFRSNLKETKSRGYLGLNGPKPDQAGLERALGVSLLDADSWYEDMQTASLCALGNDLGLSVKCPTW